MSEVWESSGDTGFLSRLVGMSSVPWQSRRWHPLDGIHRHAHSRTVHHSSWSPFGPGMSPEARPRLAPTRPGGRVYSERHTADALGQCGIQLLSDLEKEDTREAMEMRGN
jgi:hypothetical protein